MGGGGAREKKEITFLMTSWRTCPFIYSSLPLSPIPLPFFPSSLSPTPYPFRRLLRRLVSSHLKPPEEGRLVRPKYQETSSRFSLCCFVMFVYIFVLDKTAALAVVI